MFRGHGVLHRTHRDVYDTALHAVNRDMLSPRRLGGARCDPVHLFTAAEHRNTHIPDHSDDIAAMPANIECLLHQIASLCKRVCPAQGK